jgi:hypothetical protein
LKGNLARFEQSIQPCRRDLNDPAALIYTVHSQSTSTVRFAEFAIAGVGGYDELRLTRRAGDSDRTTDDSIREPVLTHISLETREGFRIGFNRDNALTGTREWQRHITDIRADIDDHWAMKVGIRPQPIDQLIQMRILIMIVNIYAFCDGRGGRPGPSKPVSVKSYFISD